MEREAWIIDAVRSPRGKGKDTGALHNVHPQRILAQVLNALRDRNGLDTSLVDDVVMGCGAGSGDHSMDIARMAALDAGWSLDAPGVTLNRFCGSGQQAVNFAAMGVLSGMQDCVVAGGIESMSRPSPMHVDGFTANNAHLRDQYDMVPQGISADLIATLEGFSREQCDALAVESQRRAAEAISEGRFEKSLVPIFHEGRPGPLHRRDCAEGVPAGRIHQPRAPRRQLVRRRRRCRCGARRLPRLREGTRAEAACTHQDDRCCRHRAGDHAHRTRTGRQARRGEGRHDVR